MSAFLVSYNHLNTVVSWAAIHIMHMPTCEELDKIGRLLWAENYISVDTRYPDDDMTDQWCELYCHRPTKPTISAIEFIKLVDCLEYQSCEHKGWSESKAKKLLDDWRHSALRQYGPYSAAKWAIA